MVRNIDIKTVHKIVSSQGSGLNIGGQVPAGMQRYVTFLMVDTVTQALNHGRVHFASVGVSNPTYASALGTAYCKMVMAIRATGASRAVNCAPNGPPIQLGSCDPQKPIFTIAASKWLTVGCSAVSAQVFVQYFDE